MKALLDEIAKRDEELFDVLNYFTQKGIITIHLEEASLALLTENDEYLLYQSEIASEVIADAKIAYQERKDFYEKLKQDLVEKIIERYPEDQIENYRKEIEEKAKPREKTVWLRDVTFHVLRQDVGSREFVRENIGHLKGIKEYIDTFYPEEQQ